MASRSLPMPSLSAPVIDQAAQKERNPAKASKTLIDAIVDKVHHHITEGVTKVQQQSSHLELLAKTDLQDLLQDSSQQKINRVNMDLKGLQQQIHAQKDEEKERENRKIREAKVFIDKLKREKHELREKIKLAHNHNWLKFSAESEKVIQSMKSRRQELVECRKKEIQLRIDDQSIEGQNDQQNEEKYPKRIKKTGPNRKHHSLKILPTIHRNPHKNIQDSEVSAGHLNKPAGHRNEAAYQDIVDHFIKQSRAPKNHSHVPATKNMSINRILNIKFEDPLQSANHSLLPGSENIRRSLKNKETVTGSQNPQEALVRIKSNSKSNLVHQSMGQGTGVQLIVNPASLHKNEGLRKEEEKWRNVLENMLKHKIPKSQAISRLASIEQKLDRMNPVEIQTRLKTKLEAFSAFNSQKLTQLPLKNNPEVLRIGEHQAQNLNDFDDQYQ